jgi:hypothetical protein
MSGFKKTLQKLTETQTPTHQPIAESSNNEITGFIHGPQVILLKGMHKGVHGYVTDFHSGKYTFTVNETFYVPKSNYTKKAGEEIVSEVPILYRLNLVDGSILDIPAEFITEIVVYKTGNKKNETLQLGNVVSKTKNENIVIESPGNTQRKTSTYVVKKINLENDDLTMMMSELNFGSGGVIDLNKLYISNKKVHAPIELVENLSKRIVNGEDFGHIFNNETDHVFSQDILDRYFIVYQGEHIGKFGVNTEIFEPQFVIEKKKIDFSLGQALVKKDANETVKIVKGKLKSDRLYNPNEYEYSPPYLSITLSTNGRKVTESTYNIGTSYDPKFITRKITPNDVFYFDVKIRDLGVAEVKKINKDGTFDAIIKNGYVYEEVPNIPFKDVVDTEPGFKWKYGQTQAQEEQKEEELFTFENADVDVADADADADADEGDEKEVADYGEEGQEEQRESEVLEAEPEMKETFNDKNRLNQEETKLTSKQQSIKNTISTIMKNAKINEDSLNIYTSTELVEQVFNQLEKKNNGKSILNTIDAKYITAALVFCEVLINHRQIDRHFGLLNFTKALINSNYLKNGDVFENNNIKYSILLKKDTGILSDLDFKQQNNKVKVFWENNKFQDIIKIMMNNALILAKKMLGREILAEPNSVNINDLIPLGKYYNPNAEQKLQHEVSYKKGNTEITMKHYSSEKETRRDEDHYMITIEELAQNKKIPEKERKILWGLDTQSLLQDTKDNLSELAKSENNPTGYQYIIKNLERGPYALREMANSDLKDYFKMVFKELLINAIKIKRRSKKLSLKRQRENEYERSNLLNRRLKIAKEKDEDNEDSEEEEIKNTNSYEKEKRIREMKQSIAKGARINARKPKETESEESEENELEETETETEEDKAWSNLRKASDEV